MSWHGSRGCCVRTRPRKQRCHLSCWSVAALQAKSRDARALERRLAHLRAVVAGCWTALVIWAVLATAHATFWLRRHGHRHLRGASPRAAAPLTPAVHGPAHLAVALPISWSVHDVALYGKCLCKMWRDGHGSHGCVCANNGASCLECRRLVGARRS